MFVHILLSKNLGFSKLQYFYYEHVYWINATTYKIMQLFSDLYWAYEVLWGNVLLKLNLGTGDGAWPLFIKANNFY